MNHEASLHEILESVLIGQTWVAENGETRKISGISFVGATCRLRYFKGRREISCYSDNFAQWVHKEKAILKG